MADFSLDDLVRPMTRAEAQASIYNVLGILGVNTTSWKPGAVVRTMIVGCSAIFAAYSELQARIARSGFLELADGEWLTLVAHYVYGVDRIPATFGVGEITLSNGGGGVYAFDTDDLVFANPTTGKTYRNTAPVSLPALKQATVAIRATEVGAASTSGPGEITQMVTTVLGVTCSNALAVIGVDEETDAQLRVRCQEKLGALSPFGPWDAYAYAVRTATRPDGTHLGINRIRIVKDGYGKVTTFVAGVNGEVPGDVDDITTDLGIANDAIQRKAAPLAVRAETVSAIDLPIAVRAHVWVYNTTPLTPEDIRARVTDALGAFFVAQPIGGNVIEPSPGKVFHEGLEAIVLAALPEIFHVEVIEPAGDVTLEPDEVPFLDGQVIFETLSFEPPPEGFGGAL